MRARLLLTALAALADGADNLSAQTAGGLDPSGLRIFWQAVDGLASRTLSPDSARRLLESHPGYRLIQRTGSRLPVITHCLRRRFPPTDADTVPTPPAARAWLYDRVCSHLDRAIAERSSLERYATDLAASAAGRQLIDAALDSARAYLPAEAAGLAAPPIYLLLFEDNGFGAEGIALDLLSFRERDPARRVLLLGHELHHVFMVRRGADLLPESAGEERPAAVWWLGRVQWEGIASLIDKRAWLSSAPTELEGFPAEHAAEAREAPARIRHLDSLLAAAGSVGPAALDSAFRASIPDGGHALGQFLATAIEGELGAERLRAATASRFEFIADYQAAAMRRPAVYPRFSEPAMAYFADLARRYQATGR